MERTQCPLQSSQFKAAEKKREHKLHSKNSKNEEINTDCSKDSSNEQTDGKPQTKKYPRNRVKKKDEYRNQVIEDHFGVFEYDKDPEGYLKARKRMLNRKSAMKSKNTKIDKIEILNQQISDLQVKSVNLEQQNSQLKNDKHELQMQVQDLLKMIQHINPGVCNDENFHKRFKLTESDETDAKPSIKYREFKYSSSSDNHSLNSEDSSSSDVLSFSEEDVGIEKTEKWLNQNDILNNVNCSSEKHRNSTTNPPDDSFSSIRHSSFEDMMEEKKEFKFVLERENNNSEVLTNIFGEAIGNMFSHASLLTLTIVMCLILCLCGTGNMEEYNGMRNPFANSPGKRTPMTADYYEIYDYSKSYFKIILATVFMIGVCIMKCGGLLSKLQFDPHKITRKAKKA